MMSDRRQEASTAQTAGTEPHVGVVTVLYNSDEVLPGFFTSLAAQQGVRLTLYVIDNSATPSGADMARELARTHQIDARVVFNGANVGVAKGNNQGIALALGEACELVLLANNDTEFESHAIARLVAALQDGERVATPKIAYHGAPDRVWFAGGHINAWLMRTPHHGLGELDRGQFDQQRHVGYAPTCFMLVRADVFAEIGMMDEQYFVYYDDSDFVWRLIAGGIRIRFVPASIVLHKVSWSTGGALSAFSLYYTNRNRVYFIRKNLRGLQKVFALAYMLSTRLPRLGVLPRALARRGWKGLRDGFAMNVTEQGR